MPRKPKFDKRITKPLRVDHLFLFTSEEFNTLKQGHISQDMDDKWDVFFEDHVLFFTRSWTGSCIFELPIQQREDDSYTADHFMVESNTEIYRRSGDDRDIELVEYLLEWIINAEKEND